jgi:hypothetical protein
VKLAHQALSGAPMENVSIILKYAMDTMIVTAMKDQRVTLYAKKELQNVSKFVIKRQKVRFVTASLDISSKVLAIMIALISMSVFKIHARKSARTPRDRLNAIATKVMCSHLMA